VCVRDRWEGVQRTMAASTAEGYLALMSRVIRQMPKKGRDGWDGWISWDGGKSDSCCRGTHGRNLQQQHEDTQHTHCTQIFCISWKSEGEVACVGASVCVYLGKGCCSGGREFGYVATVKGRQGAAVTRTRRERDDDGAKVGWPLVADGPADGTLPRHKYPYRASVGHPRTVPRTQSSSSSSTRIHVTLFLQS